MRAFGAIFWLFGLVLPLRADPVTVFAAASLGDVLAEIGGADVTLSLAGSGTIARQVAQGAPADVVVLANPDWMDWLDAQGALLPGTRSAPFGNALALIAPKGAALPDLSSKAFQHRLGAAGRLAIGNTSAVPAGQYGKAWLQTAGLWESVAPRLAETDNVRAALALVARGETPLGVVYRTDLMASDQVTEAAPIPQAQQPKIRYAVAAITENGRAFAASLSDPAAQAILRRFGFQVP